MKYNIWNKWDPLKVCMLGNNYAPEFFDGCDPKASDPLKRICEETLEDLEGYKKILQDFGVEVIQPEMDHNERFLDNPGRYSRGPLQPRDYQLVLGNHCFINDVDHPAICTKLEEYGPKSFPVITYPYVSSESHYNILAGGDYPSYENFLANRTNKEYFKDFVWEELCGFSHLFFSSASMFMLGKKLVIGTDKEAQHLTADDYIGTTPFDKFEIQLTQMDGHTDGNFHPIKPGAILSLNDVQNYEDTFPGWDVCYLPDQSWSKVKDFLQLKMKNAGKWWLAGEEENDEFTHFVETWLQDWVGYVEETVFDVNVLMLDEYHCCVSNPNNEQVNTFLKKHNVEPVYVPWRHRYFWDGGLHCITLDLYREGTQKDYFE
jgi:hypothetical protein